MKSYKEMIVWQKSFELAKEIYKLTKLFPQSEIYGLSNQLRRASVSVVSNIAEGFSRKTSKEYIQFLWVAFGSTSEVETQLLLAKDLDFVSSDSFRKSEELLLEVRKMLAKLIKVLKSK